MLWNRDLYISFSNVSTKTMWDFNWDTVSYFCVSKGRNTRLTSRKRGWREWENVCLNFTLLPEVSLLRNTQDARMSPVRKWKPSAKIGKPSPATPPVRIYISVYACLFVVVSICVTCVCMCVCGRVQFSVLFRHPSDRARTRQHVASN